ncbi:MAG: acyl--CoA ligase [Mollicutes bacterium]|nr:acyl--CoA ligase [Mollicutes bacterium]
MGKVNDYINRLINFIKNEKPENKEKPWLKYYGDVPESLNYFNGSMYDYLKDTVSKNEKRSAYSFYGNEVTFKSFMKKIDKVASALKEFNIVENECVTICMPNTPESFALIYAINKIGAICNIIHPLSSTSDIERALKETNSSIIFCSDVAMPKARHIKVKHFIMVPTSESLGKFLKTLYNIKSSLNMKLEEGMLTWHEFLNYGVSEDTYVKRDPNSPAAIIYSGGTTGKPKGIIISNANFNAMALQTASVCKYISPGHSVLSALPIFHVFGLALCTHTCLVAGMKCIIVPQLNTKKINKELKKYKPSVYPAVPSLLKMSMNDSDPGSNAFKDIKVVVVGGDYLSPQVKSEYEEYLKAHGSSAVVKSGYGLSEACGFCCCTAQVDEKHVNNHKGTLGIPNPDMIVKIFEPDSDVEKSVGDVGEICITGPTLMMGYINEDEETKKTLVIHNDGRTWLHTGDLGYMDKDGFIFYTSRLKRMIITNGYNVYPIELEDIINKCKYVDTCTVVGIPHKIKSQTPKAVIVLKSNVQDTPEVREEIRRYCYKNIAKYAVPTEYEFRTSLPKTAVGKVAYRDLEKKSN